MRALRYLLGRTEKPTRNSINEPVRQLLAKKVAAEKPQKVLEIGCGWGQNLYILSQKIPEAELHGFDINRAAIRYAKKKIPKAKLWRGTAETELEKIPDKTYDVTYTNAALMYIAPQDIKQVMQNIIKITKKKIVLVELEPDNPEDDPLGLGIYENGKWSRNYVALLTGLKKPIKISRIPRNTQLDEGWKRRGIIIEVKI